MFMTVVFILGDFYISIYDLFLVHFMVVRTCLDLAFLSQESMLSDSAKRESGNEEEEEDGEEDSDDDDDEEEEEEDEQDGDNDDDDDYGEEEQEEELLHASREGNTETLARLLLVSNKADLNKATSEVKSLLACSV
jgi:hypothetical protein